MQNLIVSKAITGLGAFVDVAATFTPGTTMPPVTATFAPRPQSRPRLRQRQRRRALAVLYEKKDAIAYVTVNRPKVLNALNTPTWKDLRTAFEPARDDVAVRGVILTAPATRRSSPAPTSANSRISRPSRRTSQPLRAGGPRSHRESPASRWSPRSMALRSAAVARPRWLAPSGSRSTPRSASPSQPSDSFRAAAERNGFRGWSARVALCSSFYRAR